MMNILLVDDHPVIHDAISNYLSGSKEEWSLAHALNGKEALALLMNRESFDLVIVDIRMPEMSGMELLENIKLNFASVKTIVLSFHFTRIDLMKMVSSKVDGILDKNIGQGDFLHALKKIRKNKTIFSKGLKSHILSVKKELKKRKDRLTRIEQRAIKYLIEGNGKRLIKKHMNLQENEFKNLITSIKHKTGSTTIQGLTVVASERGVI